MLNQHTPKRGSGEVGRTSIDSDHRDSDGEHRSESGHRASLESDRSSLDMSHSPRSHSPAPAASAPKSASKTVANLFPAVPDQHASPRSQSDTGLGSDTDTDSELRQFHHHPHSAGEAAAASSSRADRSRLSLDLPSSSSRSNSPMASSASPEPMQLCTKVVTELKMAVEKAKDFHAQVNNNNGQTSSGSSSQHQQMMAMLSEAFHDAHLALAHLALHSPSPDSHAHKPQSCPLVGEGESSSPWDSDVMDKARDMLQPFMSNLSHQLADELVKVIRDRLKDNASP